MSTARYTVTKDLLLEDYRYRAEMMRETEKAGETRINILIVLMTLVSAALVDLVTSDNRLDPRTKFLVVTGGLGALLMFGWLTLLRLIKRNQSTDECKYSLDLIRQIFKDWFDNDRILLGYYPVKWPKDKPRKYDTKKKGLLTSTRDLRSFGGLTHLVASINGLMVAGLIATLLWYIDQKDPGIVIAAGVLSFVAAVAGQVWYVRRQEERHQDELTLLQPTHAGGVVVKHLAGQDHYLLVRPKRKKHHWVLPKGHIEPGEGHGEAALREVKEETGIAARLISPLGQWDFVACRKRVRLKIYLMAYEADGAKQEDRGVHWADLEGSIAAATYPETEESLAMAGRAIDLIRAQERTRTMPETASKEDV